MQNSCVKTLKSAPYFRADPIALRRGSYAISKVVNEETAKGFQRRSGIDIYGLRIGNVFEPDDYKMFKDFSNNPELRLPNLFNYIDARDLAQAVELCIEKNGLGYEVFNVSNDNNSVNLKNSEIIKRFYKNLKIYDDLEEYVALLLIKEEAKREGRDAGKFLLWFFGSFLILCQYL